MLNSTRLYALEKLNESGERRDACRRHAEYYCGLLAKAEAESDTLPAPEWRAAYAGHLDNVRAALVWAFSRDGDPAIGVALTANAVPLSVRFSLMGECRTWAERALAHLESQGDGSTRERMQLSAALGWSLMFAVGAARATRAAWTTTLALAGRLDDNVYRLRALWGTWVDRLNNGQQAQALDLARRFAAIVAPSSNAIDLMMADRMLATSLHFMGDQTQARHHIESMLARYAASGGRRLGARFQFDQQVTAHYFLARILWLLGFADQAMRMVEHNIEEARTIGNALSLSSVLGQGACPIALLCGDLDAAERYGEMLRDHAGRHSLRIWQTWADCFIGVAKVRRGGANTGLRTLQEEFGRAGDALVLPRYLLLLGELSRCLGEASEAARGLLMAEDAIARCEASGEGWYCRSCGASRVSSSGKAMRMTRRPRRRSISCVPSIWRGCSRPERGSCAPRSASRGYGETRAAARRRATTCPRFTRRSPRVSRPPICGWRDRCCRGWGDAVRLNSAHHR